MKPIKSQTARLSFVGSGPGDPELLTLRAATRLREADLVLYDALVTPEILALANPAARLINVGKRSGRHSMTQSTINKLLVRLARGGQRLVRLKGGDPVIFGRLREEMQALDRAGFAYEIVPGITTASAVAASVGMSLTQRGIAQRVQFVTGHAEDGSDFDPVRAGVCDRSVTSIIYMARKAAPFIRQGLLNAGWPADMPVLIVTSVSRPDQTSLRVSLAALDHAVAALPASLPLVLVVGDVVASASWRNTAMVGDAQPADLGIWLGD